ncbi:MAG TPA: hypothetical protein VJ885_08370 [Thermoanaerobaculia bacterium]|nr:hypothetical protein [Thermoanaerobaculia bacterium]
MSSLSRSLWIAVLCSSLAAATSPVLAQVVRNGSLPTPLPLFPPDNWWNVDISAAPVDPNSANFIIFIGPTDGLHPDFGGDDEENPPGIYGMPYISVPGTQPLVPVTWVEYGDQSDNGFPGRPIGYPIPPEAKTQAKWFEGGPAGNVDTGGDRHMLIVDRDNRILYELYHTFWNAALNRWEAGSGAIYSLDSNHRRPDTWTSADAAGLTIFPGLVRYDEAFGSEPIKHAFRVTVRRTLGHVYPASHTASTSGDQDALPMGARLRLKASTVIPANYPEYLKRIFQAMKTYGLIVADNGSDMYIQGQYDTRWDNGVLNPAFYSLKASDFEVIQLGWKPSTSIPANLDFYTVTPCRLLDTRQASGQFGGPSLPPGISRVLRVGGRCSIPSTAKAVAVNATVFEPPGFGNLRFFPGDGEQAPVTSTLNFQPGITRANNAILMLSSSGSGTLAAQSSVAGVHLVVDVTGYSQ